MEGSIWADFEVSIYRPLAQPSLPAKTHQIPAEAKATPAFIICVSVCLCYQDKASYLNSIFSATTGRILLKFET